MVLFEIEGFLRLVLSVLMSKSFPIATFNQTLLTAPTVILRLSEVVGRTTSDVALVSFS
jgi:hypothetical protein